MKLEKNKIEEVFQTLKYMPEDVVLDMVAEERTFFKKAMVPQKKKSFYAKYGKYAAVLVIGFLCFLGYFTLNQKNNHNPLMAETLVSRGNTGKVILPDGSCVWLNADSKITYEGFNKNSEFRKVTLEGEGYFEVVKNNKPFIVNIKNDVQIKVLGTTFNVRAYSNDNRIETSLITGKVQLRIKDSLSRKNIDMVAGEKVIYKEKTKEIYVKKELNIADENRWIEGNIIFKEESLYYITKELERVYDVEVYVDEEDSKEIMITASFNKKSSIEEILKMLKVTSNFNYKYSNNKWILSK